MRVLIRLVWGSAVSSFFCREMWMDTRLGSGGLNHSGLARRSIVSSWVDGGVRSATVADSPELGACPVFSFPVIFVVSNFDFREVFWGEYR